MDEICLSKRCLHINLCLGISGCLVQCLQQSGSNQTVCWEILFTYNLKVIWQHFITYSFIPALKSTHFCHCHCYFLAVFFSKSVLYNLYFHDYLFLSYLSSETVSANLVPDIMANVILSLWVSGCPHLWTRQTGSTVLAVVGLFLKGFDALIALFLHSKPSATNLLQYLTPSLSGTLSLNVCWENEELCIVKVDSSLSWHAIIFGFLSLFWFCF